MANKGISQLQDASALTGMELVPLVQNGVTKKALTLDLAALAQVTIENDTTTATAEYPLFSNVSSGTAATIYTSSPKYKFTPSTGELSVPEVVASNGLFVNSATVNSSYTVQSGNNAMSAGPITVAGGATVTVVDGTWTIVGTSPSGGLPQPYGVAGDVLVSTGSATTPAWEVLDGGSF